MHEPLLMNQAYPPLSITNPTSNQMNNSLGNSLQELNLAPSDDDWEYVTDGSSDNGDNGACKEEKADFEERSMIHRCESTPEFSSFSSIGGYVTPEDDTSYVLDCDSSCVDAQSISTTASNAVLLSQKTTSNPMKKVPSFKDMVASNAEQLQNEEKQKKMDLKALEEKRRQEAMQRRKAFKTRIVVTPIKRCARSTGDLRSLVIHEDEEGHGGGGGGGGGCMSAVIHEEEILGDSDAAEYYNRKAHGSKGRENGRKIRPDEQKRKDFIIHKKNAQRKAQGVVAAKKT